MTPACFNNPTARRQSLSAVSTLAVASLLAISAGRTAEARVRQHYEASITRTTYGIPHIKGANASSVAYGAAWAEAEDNVCLLAETYLGVRGERSRYFGADGPATIGVWPAKNLENDVYYNEVIDEAVLKRNFSHLSKDGQALIDGWVAGYNDYLFAHKNHLPTACAGQAWVKPIGREEVLRWMNSFLLFDSAAGLSVAMADAAPPSSSSAALQPSYKDAAKGEPIALPLGDRLGSNGWAFGADATTNGRGLVIGNPHFPWFGPHRFYEMHLTIPGKLDVAGAAIMGQPFVAIGFNKDVAWTHTVDTAVHMTLAKLTLDPKNPTVYLVDGKRVPMTKRQITVLDKDGRRIVRTAYATRFGPIITIPGTPYSWTHTTAYAVTDANRNNIRSPDTYLGFAEARRVEDMRKTLIHTLGAGFINTMAADRSGAALFADIAPAPNLSDKQFAACGTIGEKLKALYTPFYALDASRSACGWRTSPTSVVPGLLPGAQMAFLVRRDYVQNSNDSYRWTNAAISHADGAIMWGNDPGKTPDPRTRAGVYEITKVLKTGQFDIDVGAATMLGNQNFIGQRILPDLLTLCHRPSAPQEACAALAKWDGQDNLDSRGAMLFEQFWAKAMARPGLWTVPFSAGDFVETPRGLAIEGATGDALLADLASAATEMKERGLALDAPLGEVQFAERGSERIPLSGAPNGGVLNYMKAVPAKGGYAAIHGSSYIQAVGFDDHGPVAKAVLTYSQSTDPASPHYADQTRAFSKLQLRAFPFSEADITADRVGEPEIVGR